MKLTSKFLFVCSFLSVPHAFAQEEQPAPAAPMVKTTATVKAVSIAAPDIIKGNAAKDVSIVNATGACTGSMKPIGIFNKADGRSVMVKIELSVTYSGHISRKNQIIDNIGPNETRFIGCSGCQENASGQACSTYKIIAAVYK